MNRPKTRAIALDVAPIVTFATYIAWIVVPIVLAEFVTAAMRAVMAN